MSVNVDRDKKTVTLNQRQYIEQILKRFNMFDCKPVSTPLEAGIKLEKVDNVSCDVPYQQLIGSLMYLSILTRPDLSFSLSYLSQFNSCFDESH